MGHEVSESLKGCQASKRPYRDIDANRVALPGVHRESRRLQDRAHDLKDLRGD
ncbi:hypothetical protein HMPREF9056_02514 [Actinomyces sp. oral taxon 170 str. F0386]|nr:hypothetical protein HMPREF9056_02514 [Actinomyces sp. oral taxon 170 str. F0386]